MRHFFRVLSPRKKNAPFIVPTITTTSPARAAEPARGLISLLRNYILAIICVPAPSFSRRRGAAVRSAAISAPKRFFRARDPGVKTPWTGASKNKVEIEETVQHCWDAIADGREERYGEPELEVRDRHFPSQNERHGAREKTQDDQQASESLQHSGDAHFGHQAELRQRHGARRVAEKLHRSRTDEHGACNNPQNTEHSADVGLRIGIEYRHSGCSLKTPVKVFLWRSSALLLPVHF